MIRILTPFHELRFKTISFNCITESWAAYYELRDSVSNQSEGLHFELDRTGEQLTPDKVADKILKYHLKKIK